MGGERNVQRVVRCGAYEKESGAVRHGLGSVEDAFESARCAMSGLGHHDRALSGLHIEHASPGARTGNLALTAWRTVAATAHGDARRGPRTQLRRIFTERTYWD